MVVYMDASYYYELLMHIVRLAVWLMGLVILFVPLERFFAVHPHRLLRQEVMNDVGYYFLSSLFPAFLLSVPIAVVAWGASRLVPDFVPEAMSSLPIWGRVAAAFVVGDLGYYWGHRWCHEIPFLWRFHAIHHSAENMDFLVHTRAHPLDMVFGRLCGLVPIFLLGLAGPTKFEGSLVPVVVNMIGVVWGFFIHANLRWRFGPLEWLISTPAFHHWHHTKTGAINRNFSANLPLLDAIFGSLYLPKEWPADYGIKTPMPRAMVDQLVDPLFPPLLPAQITASEPEARA
jgi:sterol desaturase/sphingolipid hydroxylase (fatty acid hydroxylase superfamily)